MKNKKTRSKVYTRDESSPMNSPRKHRKVSPSLRVQQKLAEAAHTQKEWMHPFNDENPLRIGSIAHISNQDINKLNKEVKNITCNIREDNDDGRRKEQPTTQHHHYFDHQNNTTLKMQSSLEIVANNERTLTHERNMDLVSKESYPTGRSYRSKEPVTPQNQSVDHDEFQRDGDMTPTIRQAKLNEPIGKRSAINSKRRAKESTGREADIDTKVVTKIHDKREARRILDSETLHNSLNLALSNDQLTSEAFTPAHDNVMLINDPFGKIPLHEVQ